MAFETVSITTVLSFVTCAQVVLFVDVVGVLESGKSQVTFPIDFLVSQVRLKVDPG